MKIEELEQRWKSITNTGSVPYRSLRISASCIPNLFVALDMSGHRYMILQVPKEVDVCCTNVKMQNLSLEWHEETRFILIGLLNKNFADLYNDFVLSLYSRIKSVLKPVDYTKEFIESFNKWSEFFNDFFSNRLTDAQVKGIFGELIVLKHYTTTTDVINLDNVLNAWVGPYGRAQDFNFFNLNVEVKTKDIDQVAIRISSEFQLQPEIGKDLQLTVVNVQRHDDGYNIEDLISSIKEIVLLNGADASIFLKALSKLGLNGNNISQYQNLRWKPLQLGFYDCNATNDFPRIIASLIPTEITHVKYNITVNVLQQFLIQTIEL